MLYPQQDSAGAHQDRYLHKQSVKIQDQPYVIESKTTPSCKGHRQVNMFGQGVELSPLVTCFGLMVLVSSSHARNVNVRHESIQPATLCSAHLQIV